MRVLRWFARWCGACPPDAMSPTWLRQQRARLAPDTGSVAWRWPINKQLNEEAQWNRWVLRNRWRRELQHELQSERRVRARARFLAEVRRLDGYTVEPLTDAGDGGCVAIWRATPGGRYLVMREIGFDEWEHD